MLWDANGDSATPFFVAVMVKFLQHVDSRHREVMADELTLEESRPPPWSHILRSEPTTPVVDFGLRHSGLERGERCRKTFSSFRFSTCPANIAHRWRQEELNLARPKGAKRQLKSTFKKPAWNHGDAWSPGL